MVEVDGRVVGSIGRGLLVYVGITPGDDEATLAKMADKIVNLRIFDDPAGKLNLSVKDMGGGVLLISNFTLMGDARQGRRPSYTLAQRPEIAGGLYQQLVEAVRATGVPVAAGVFQASMIIDSKADGPVNIVVDVVGS